MRHPVYWKYRPVENFQVELTALLRFFQNARFVICRVCQQVCKDIPIARKVHIYDWHLKKRLFSCAECGFARNSIPAVAEHTRLNHPGKCIAILRAFPKCGKSYDDFNVKCFPENSRVGDVSSENETAVAVPPSAARVGTPNSAPIQNSSRSTCQLCQKRAQKSRHIWKVHIDLPIYSCDQCGYNSTHSVHPVREHVKYAHINEITTPRVSVTVQKHRAAYDRFERACFPARSGDDAGNSNRAGRIRCKLCRKWCSESLKMKRRHILRCHLRKRLFRCSYCRYRNSHGSGLVRRHMAEVHPNEEIAVITDYMERKRVKYDLLWKYCFGQDETRDKRKKSKLISCELCGDQLKSSTGHKIKHIWSMHLDQPIFFCKHCPYSHKFSLRHVKRHVKKAHGSKKFAVISKSGEFREQFDVFVDLCFGGSLRKKTASVVATAEVNMEAALTADAEEVATAETNAAGAEITDALVEYIDSEIVFIGNLIKNPVNFSRAKVKTETVDLDAEPDVAVEPTVEDATEGKRISVKRESVEEDETEAAAAVGIEREFSEENMDATPLETSGNAGNFAREADGAVPNEIVAEQMEEENTVAPAGATAFVEEAAEDNKRNSSTAEDATNVSCIPLLIILCLSHGSFSAFIAWKWK